VRLKQQELILGICDQKDGIYLPGGWGFDDNIVPPSSADWNILEVVYDGTSQKGYINGVLKGTTTFLLDTVDKELEIGLRTGKTKQAQMVICGNYWFTTGCWILTNANRSRII